MHLAVTKALLASFLTVFNCTGADSCTAPQQKIISKQTSHLEASSDMQTVKIQEKVIVNPLERSMEMSPKDEVKLAVPFSSQAPDHNWVDPYDEACEETSVIMVEYYLRGAELTTETANSEINSIINWQRERGFAVDIGAADTAFHARNFYNRTTHVYYDDEVTEENYKYSPQTIMTAIHDWTGEKATTEQGRRAMVVITK